MPHVQKKLIFSERTEKQIINYYESPKNESKTDGVQVKLTTTQKVALRHICQERGIGVSTFIADAIEHRLKFLALGEKWSKYESAILAFVESLPD